MRQLSDEDIVVGACQSGLHPALRRPAARRARRIRQPQCGVLQLFTSRLPHPNHTEAYALYMAVCVLCVCVSWSSVWVVGGRGALYTEL